MEMDDDGACEKFSHLKSLYRVINLDIFFSLACEKKEKIN
jgi:hypothetical protein